jgi:hypothetical protein
MRDSPRIRRLRNDLSAMQQLQDESSILHFHVPGPLHGGLPEVYRVEFRGRGLWQRQPNAEVLFCDRHEVSIQLGASYPRMMPEIRWKTPIFHPNISASGSVCLGGYSTHWAPSLRLDELCAMLWDMIRYQNYDVTSPYNREAAKWAREQTGTAFPLDRRPIRDRVASQVDVQAAVPHARSSCDRTPTPEAASSSTWPRWSTLPATTANRAMLDTPAILFVDDEIVDAELVVRNSQQIVDAEILFIE